MQTQPISTEVKLGYAALSLILTTTCLKYHNFQAEMPGYY